MYVKFSDTGESIQERLRTSERLAAVGELSAVLAHEVRNPLTALKMMGHISNVPDQKKQYGGRDRGRCESAG